MEVLCLRMSGRKKVEVNGEITLEKRKLKVMLGLTNGAK